MNTFMPETQADSTELVITQNGFSVADSGWTAFGNQIFGFYDGHNVQPGLAAYLSGSELALYTTLVRLTQGYHRTWTRISLGNLKKLTGLSDSTIIAASKSLQAKAWGDNEGETLPLIEVKNDGGILLWRVIFENIDLFLAHHPTAKIAVKYRENRGEVPRKSRQSTAKIAVPSSKEIKEIKEETQTNARVCEFQNISPLAKAMATALGLDLQVKTNFDCISLTLKRLQSLYGNDVTETNIIKVSSLVLGHHGASPAKVYSQWQTFMRDTAPKSATEQKAAILTTDIESVANRIKVICKPPSPLGWEHSSVRAKKRLLTELATAIAMNHQESRLDSFSWWGGSQQPSIDQFGKAWVDHTAKGILPSRNHQVDIQENNRRAEEWLVGATVGA